MNTKEIKHNVKNAAEHLAKHGIEVPHTLLLEALARAIGQRNWGVLRSRLERMGESLPAEDSQAQPAQAWSPEMGPMTDAEFTAHGGNRCPFCGSHDVEGEDLEADGACAWDSCRCLACEATWSTAYSVTGYFDAAPGKGVPQEEPELFDEQDVVILTRLCGASLKYKAYAWRARAAHRILSGVSPNNPEEPDFKTLLAGKSKTEAVKVMLQHEHEATYELEAEYLTPIFSAESDSKADAVALVFDRVPQARAYVLRFVGQQVVDDIVEHCKDKQREYGWRVRSFEHALEVAQESAGVLGLEPNAFELRDAAFKLY